MEIREVAFAPRCPGGVVTGTGHEGAARGRASVVEVHSRWPTTSVGRADRTTSARSVVMARIEREELGDRSASRVFIAASLDEAHRVEEQLTSVGVDYVVQVEPFVGSLFSKARNGAAFYVISRQADYCRSRLAAAGLSRGVVEDPE